MGTKRLTNEDRQRVPGRQFNAYTYLPVPPAFLLGAMLGARGTLNVPRPVDERVYRFRKAGIWHLSGNGRTATAFNPQPRLGGPPPPPHGTQTINFRQMIHLAPETNFGGLLHASSRIIFLSKPVFVATCTEDRPIIVSTRVDGFSSVPPSPGEVASYRAYDGSDLVSAYPAGYRYEDSPQQAATGVVRTWDAGGPCSAAFDWMCDIEVGVLAV